LLQIKNGGTIIQVNGTVVGADIEFELPDLMPEYSYELSLYKADGTKYVNEDGADCFFIDIIRIIS